MSRFQFLYLFPLLVLATGCPSQPQEAPLPPPIIGPTLPPQEAPVQPLTEQKKPKINITKYTTETWSGDPSQYCSLKLLNPLKAFYENIDSLKKNGQVQEAIWLLEERGQTEKEAATELKNKLSRLFSEGHYKIIPKELGGSVKKHLLEFEGGIFGLFKSAEDAKTRGYFWADEKAEVAAYHLDQLLGFDIVPLTVLRRMNGEDGSIQYYFSTAEEGSPEQTASRNFAALKVFDYITANFDRKAPNFLYWTEQDRVIAIDNGGEFKDHECGDPQEVKQFLELAPSLKEKIYKIQEDEIEKTLTHYLSQDAISAVIRRINLLRGTSEKASTTPSVTLTRPRDPSLYSTPTYTEHSHHRERFHPAGKAAPLTWKVSILIPL